MYSAGTVDQSLVIRSRAPHLGPSDGHHLRVFPQSHRSYHALNSGPPRPLSHSFNNRVFGR